MEDRLQTATIWYVLSFKKKISFSGYVDYTELNGEMRAWGEKWGRYLVVVVLILESWLDCTGGENLVRQGRTAADGLVAERPLPKIGTSSTAGSSRRMSVAISARHQEHGRWQRQCQREQQQQ